MESVAIVYDIEVQKGPAATISRSLSSSHHGFPLALPLERDL